LYGSKVDDSLLNNSENEATDEKTAASTSTGKAGSGSAAPQPVDSHAHHKAKPNKELLEKLKEEMRKLKRQNEHPSSDKNPNFDLMNKDTLLTIPPLLLGDKEFKFTSDNYLMVTGKPGGSDEGKENPSDVQEDMIVFSSSCRVEIQLEGGLTEKRPLDNKETDAKRMKRDSRSEGEVESNSESGETDDSNEDEDDDTESDG
jgi:hypothetical protein